MKSLGKRLKKSREEAGYKQIEACKKLGISNGTLSGYERDYRDPDTETLYKMSSLYEVSVDWLLGNVDDPRQNTDEREDEKSAIINKIVRDFPDADLMFHDMANMDSEQLQEVYEFIKFKMSQKDK